MRRRGEAGRRPDVLSEPLNHNQIWKLGKIRGGGGTLVKMEGENVGEATFIRALTYHQLACELVARP